ncbi:hypothetical protein BDA99DRAFT_523436 [Phascolomyces articulosus]|uniref:Uncharacterized protein n=1 Tax=Phascolomyces articulosus TaxID=60185 RepID=A0AAD5JQH6_9FUNG|nr:hypothetical protein BDA99DRAFT_523436 [Phascolomyces articulosus]
MGYQCYEFILIFFFVGYGTRNFTYYFNKEKKVKVFHAWNSLPSRPSFVFVPLFYWFHPLLTWLFCLSTFFLLVWWKATM